MANMATYLQYKVADYISTEFSVIPDGTMEEEGQKRQYYHEYDSGDLEVVTTSDSYFTVTMSWDLLSYDDSETILEFYHDVDKANARKRTFYWVHPTDGNTYVVRFASDLTQSDDATKFGTKDTSSITLRVEGVKA